MPGGVKIWIDAQLSPSLAAWLNDKFGVEALHLRELNLVNASDPSNFRPRSNRRSHRLNERPGLVELVHRLGVPPQIIWITCGNTSNREMMRVLETTFEKRATYWRPVKT
jgi:predicted nuclease of predicted toxin-antitoxin system